MQKYLKILITPLCIIGILFLFGLVWKLFNLPPESELIPIVKNYFDVYGIWLVFISAIVESAFIVGIYAPGGLVIFLGVIFSIDNPARVVAVVASVIVGFLIGFSIDFVLGKYGWYKFFLHLGLDRSLTKTKERIQKYGISVAWLGYHHPDLGSIVATAYGILQYSYKKFILIAILPVTAWCAFWGILAYIFGDQVLKFMGYQMLFIILGVWIIARIIETRFAKEVGE